jgi:uncharacterized membrane protein YhaH (DUF805 family)
MTMGRILTLRGRLTRTNYMLLLVAASAGVSALEFWLLSSSLRVVLPFSFPAMPLAMPPLYLAARVAIDLLVIALMVSRLHDMGRSGWWVLAWPLAGAATWALAATAHAGLAGPLGASLALAMLAGWLALLLWPGDIGPNRFGPDPRGWTSREHFDAQRAALAADAEISRKGGSRHR